VVVAVGQVCACLNKLESQVKESKRLRPAQKNAALATISSFRPLFELQRFAESSQAFRSNCNEGLRGHLGLIGLSLEQEFSEPLLEKPDADDLTVALAEVRKLLVDSNIPLDLRISLMKHVDAMTWWLAHPEMASVQDLFETVASAMIVAKQIEDRDAKRDTHEPSVSRTILERVSEVCTKLGRLVGLTVRGIEAVDRLSSQASHLLETLHPSS
jgi:hypothetical protein